MNKFPGLYRAVVKSNTDPTRKGRVLVSIPAISAEPEWAALSIAAGRRARVVLPEVGDEVIVSFEAGDPRSPVCVGFLWDSQPPPTAASDSDRRRG